MTTICALPTLLVERAQLSYYKERSMATHKLSKHNFSSVACSLFILFCTSEPNYNTHLCWKLTLKIRIMETQEVKGKFEKIEISMELVLTFETLYSVNAVKRKIHRLKDQKKAIKTAMEAIKLPDVEIQNYPGRISVFVTTDGILLVRVDSTECKPEKRLRELLKITKSLIKKYKENLSRLEKGEI